MNHASTDRCKTHPFEKSPSTSAYRLTVPNSDILLHLNSNIWYTFLRHRLNYCLAPSLTKPDLFSHERHSDILQAEGDHAEVSIVFIIVSE